MNPCVTMLIFVCLSTMLAKCVQRAEQFSQRKKSTPNEIAAINHPPLVYKQSTGKNAGNNIFSPHFAYNIM